MYYYCVYMNDLGILKFLEFNGKAVYFRAVDAQYWVAIKPICEALGLEYTRVFKNVKSHALFRDVLAIQPMRDTKNRLQQMISLPERYVYGWIFTLRSESEELAQYQRECCDLLYNYFHGATTGRPHLLMQRRQLHQEVQQLTQSLETVTEYKLLEDKKQEQKRITAELKKLDALTLSRQVPMFEEKEGGQ